jgi:hypothetical protein
VTLLSIGARVGMVPAFTGVLGVLACAGGMTHVSDDAGDFPVSF